MTGIRVGIGAPRGALRGRLDERRAALSAVADAGLDHVGVGDHVSFFTGVGFDGLIQAAQLLTLHETLQVYVAVYLIPLRHPTVVARQIQSVCAPAPGRLVLGVGVGGEDPHELEVCGVNPRTRGRRANEALAIVRGLMTGEPVDFRGEFFALERAVVRPAVEPRVPIVVGGRSTAAIQRAARLGDGYIGIWISAKRFSTVVGEIAREAAASGREPVDWQHAMFVWCGMGEKRDDARRLVADAMQGVYRIGFENFERYTPFGTPADIAAFLAPYADAGCRCFHLAGVAESDEALIAHAAEVKRLLNA